MYLLPRKSLKIPGLFLIIAMMVSTGVLAQDGDEAYSPLRLSYVEGDVSFWRNGAEDWVEARPNTPLAVGDAIYIGNDGDLELQMGNRAFIRADDETHISLVNQTADFIQFKITSGRVSLDLRTLPPGNSIEVNTPNAVFTIDHAGYYRVDVDDDVNFITRRGGRAMMVLADGQAMSIHPSEEIVVQGDEANAETYVAPELDKWDRWNYDRSEKLVDAVSERYLPYGIAGASDLDRYGNWRVVAEYGPVWVPETAPSGWAPYSSGRWVWDPYYQWTWIDDAPWGWAPFHYGRWVHLGGYWAWAPGPLVKRAVYAPAMVAFFGVSPGASVGISFGGAGVGWVALSWGEPLMPWWGRPHFIGRPWWGGWGGPRLVNNVVIRNTTVINVTNITYKNTRINNAVVATTQNHFGKGSVQPVFGRVKEMRELTQVRGTLPVKPDLNSVEVGERKNVRPPAQVLSRSVMATRVTKEPKLPWHDGSSKASSSQYEKGVGTEQRIVKVPKSSVGVGRPQFGAETGGERTRPATPAPFKERQHGTEMDGMDNGMEEREQNRKMEFESPPPRPSREEREKERAVETMEPSRAPILPRDTSEITKQEKRLGKTDLPGKSANKVYRSKAKSTEGGKNKQPRSRD